jgi:hypothetical protein
MAGNHFIELSEYEGYTHFYSLPQKGIFDILRNRYGRSLEVTMKITVDDKIRGAGLVITKAPLREYLLDLTARSHSGNRHALDASRSRRNAGLSLLHANFIDKMITVAMPQKWFEDETKDKIDEFMREGTSNDYGGFNPKNISVYATTDDLLDALRDYASDWNDRLHVAANHEANWAVAALVELSTDEQLRSWLLTFDTTAEQ